MTTDQITKELTDNGHGGARITAFLATVQAGKYDGLPADQRAPAMLNDFRAWSSANPIGE